MKNDRYRSLSEDEIVLLRSNGCSAEDWGDVLVKDGFNAEHISGCRFSGHIRIGIFGNPVVFACGGKRRSGIYDAVLHDVSVGDGCLIENIRGGISSYDIGDNVRISDIGRIYVDGETSFGNGHEVNVLDETGSRSVRIFSGMSAQYAYVAAMCRFRPAAAGKIEEFALAVAEKARSRRGMIGSGATITGAGLIRNVKIGEHAVIEGCAVLENGTIDSSRESAAYVGHGVICRDFIISSGARVYDGASVSGCFIGQASHVGKGFSATDSLFFSNVQMENGEACSVFAGPFTVSHHKSTLLIGGMFSFMNAGSGTNQSNHMYKSGPVHHGLVERGSKTGSGSYMMFPAHVGAFSFVSGHHSLHIDSSDFPFSYVIEKNGATLLLPAVNLKTAGTFRDVSKWPARDKMTGLRTDRIIYDFPGPYLVRKMLSGRKILEDLLHGPADMSGNYACKGMLIPERAASKGLALYGMAIDKFLGDSLIKWFAAAGCLKGFMEELSNSAGSLSEDDFSGGIAGWTDLAGLAAPVAEADGLLDRIENGDISSVGDLENCFSEIAGNYDRNARMWTCGLIMRFYGKEGFSYKGIMEIIGKWKEAARSLFMMVMEDSKKEYSDEFAVSACPDRGDEVRNADFRQTRGDFDSSSLAESLKNSFGQALADGEALESAVAEACREAGACGNRK